MKRIHFIDLDNAWFNKNKLAKSAMIASLFIGVLMLIVGEFELLNFDNPKDNWIVAFIGRIIIPIPLFLRFSKFLLQECFTME